MKIDRHPTCHPDRPYFAKDQCQRCYHAQAQRLYYDRHPNSADASQKKWLNKKKLQSIAIRHANFIFDLEKNHRQKAILNEVAHHLKKGRTPAEITVWMNKPMSIVNKAIEQLRQPL